MAYKVFVGFDYEFHAIQNGDNELLKAYSEMFEVAVSRPQGQFRTVLTLYFPFLNALIVGWLLISYNMLLISLLA